MIFGLYRESFYYGAYFLECYVDLWGKCSKSVLGSIFSDDVLILQKVVMVVGLDGLEEPSAVWLYLLELKSLLDIGVYFLENYTDLWCECSGRLFRFAKVFGKHLLEYCHDAGIVCFRWF